MIAAAGMVEMGQRLFGGGHSRRNLPPPVRFGTVGLVQGWVGRFQLLEHAIQENVLLKLFTAGWTEREMRVGIFGAGDVRTALPKILRQFCQLIGRKVLVDCSVQNARSNPL